MLDKTFKKTILKENLNGSIFIGTFLRQLDVHRTIRKSSIQDTLHIASQQSSDSTSNHHVTVMKRASKLKGTLSVSCVENFSSRRLR